MHLTLYSDYSLRVLIYLAVQRPEPASIAQISEAYRISRHHLVKIANRLGHLGFIDTTRGRGGGLRLTREPGDITVGELVRATETMHLVECFVAEDNTCPIVPVCALKKVLSEAAEGFLSVLDQYTLADLITHPRRIAQLLSIGSRGDG